MVLAAPVSSAVSGAPATSDPTALFFFSASSSLEFLSSSLLFLESSSELSF